MYFIPFFHCAVAACPNGTQWRSEDEMCVPCPQGSYRTKDIHYVCVDCPRGQETAQSGAVSHDQCLGKSIYRTQYAKKKISQARGQSKPYGIAIYAMSFVILKVTTRDVFGLGLSYSLEFTQFAL